MKNIDKKAMISNTQFKSIMTRKYLEGIGFTYVTENNENVIFGNGYDRVLLDRLKGKTERFKYIVHCQSKRGHI